MVFKDYAKYYDLLYKDKDYNGEADYIESLIKKYSLIPVKTILNMGCGTGKHDMFLNKKGYTVTGVDFSSEMIDIARINNPEMEYHCGDICNIKLNREFDCIISLFHVISYQTTNEALFSAINNAYKHLKKDGIFIFDFWYGPAVLNDRPVVRFKQLENDDIKVSRIAEPAIEENLNLVDIKYSMIINDKHSNTNYEFTENHKMRYFFLPEIQFFLENGGLKLKAAFEWLSVEKKLSFKSWYGIVICQK